MVEKHRAMGAHQMKFQLSTADANYVGIIEQLSAFLSRESQRYTQYSLDFVRQDNLCAQP